MPPAPVDQALTAITSVAVVFSASNRNPQFPQLGQDARQFGGAFDVGRQVAVHVHGGHGLAQQGVHLFQRVRDAQGAQNIDSAMAPHSVRAQAWQRLARDLDISKLASITHEIALGEAIAVAADLLDGKVRGRIVVDVNR
jgi:hypothetical protein